MTVPSYRFSSRIEWETSSIRFDPDRQWVTRAHARERARIPEALFEQVLQSGHVRLALIFEKDTLEEIMVCLHDLFHALGQSKWREIHHDDAEKPEG